jgi:hypothetical protein
VYLDNYSLNLELFVDLMKQAETADEELQHLENTVQSIHRRVQYCNYHYDLLRKATSPDDLRDDRYLQRRRENEVVRLRFVYEANIEAFLCNLHALLDSFPYLLNLFFPVAPKNNTRIMWHIDHLNKYKDYGFYDDLVSFMLCNNFNKVKGYVNTSKHKYLIRVANCLDHIEFEKLTYKELHLTSPNKVEFNIKEIERDNVIDFLKECHDNLIPQFFDLCKKVLEEKGCELAL